MKVLIVEDDRALGLFLQKGLKLEGHDTEWVEDGEAALHQLRINQPDLMLLDLSLPRRDGLEVLEELRTFSTEIAVLVLTGRNNLDERVRCLNLGADDCLLKPFSFHELIARCRAILRRQNGNSGAFLRFGNIEMDLIRRKVKCHDREIELTPKEYALLEALMRRKGACCSREELLREVWHTSKENATNSVDVCITYVRKKLNAGICGDQHRNFIETVRGAGYRIASPYAPQHLYKPLIPQNALARSA